MRPIIVIGRCTAELLQPGDDIELDGRLEVVVSATREPKQTLVQLAGKKTIVTFPNNQLITLLGLGERH